jgi:hypothetical protein
LCDTSRVGAYASSYRVSWNKISTSARLFYRDLNRKADESRPSAVTDLRISKTPTPGQWQLTWTTPADLGAGGEIQIKYDTVPIIRYEDFNATKHRKWVYYFNDGEDWLDTAYGYKVVAWWQAKNLDNEVAPLPGTYQSQVISLPGEPVYFALRTRDAAGNWSDMSNAVTGDQHTPIGRTGDKRLGRLSLNASPNPFNPATSIRYSVPASADKRLPVHLSVYNVKGQCIRRLLRGVRRPAGTHTLVWQGDDSRMKPVGAGFYLLKLQVAGKTLLRPLILSK